MPIDTPLALLAGFLVASLAAWVLLKIPFYQRLHAGDKSKSRFPSLDGYRGYLALAVVVFHAYLGYFLLRDGTRAAATSPFFDFLGKAAVAQFFLITGFLFWGKAIDGKLRLFSMDPFSHYVSRAWRLGPLYLLAAIVILAVVGVQTHFKLQVKPAALAGEISRLLALGAFTVNHVNGVDTLPINGVRWTLHYEWVFYLILPVIGVMAMGRRFLVLCAALGLGLLITQSLVWTKHLKRDPIFDSFALWLFIGGMAAAHLLRIMPARLAGILRSPWTILPMAALASVIAFKLDANNQPWGVLINVLIFLPIAAGNSLLGILNWKTSRFLSTISYSIYLMHPFVLHPFSAGREWLLGKQISPAWYWSLECIAIIAAVCLASLTYRWLEHPFMHRKLQAALKPARPAQETALPENTAPLAPGLIVETLEPAR